MNKKTTGICCGGSYLADTADFVNPNAHQGSPSKRHNADKDVFCIGDKHTLALSQSIAKFMGYTEDKLYMAAILINLAIANYGKNNE